MILAVILLMIALICKGRPGKILIGVNFFKNYVYTVAHCAKKTGLKRTNTKLSLNATPNPQYETNEISSHTQEKVSKHAHAIIIIVISFKY